MKTPFIRMLFYFLIPVALSSCVDKTDKSSNKETIVTGYSSKTNNIKSGNLPSQKLMTISKEGMEDTIIAKLYRSPADFPVPFSLYYPSELDAGQVDRNTVQFKRNEGVLQLHFFPENIKTREEALELAMNVMKESGEVIESKNGFRLKPNAQTSASIEINEENGRYYYWYANYPVEYGDGFGAEIYFIKKNLEWG